MEATVVLLLACVVGLITFDMLVQMSIEIDQSLFDIAKAAKKAVSKSTLGHAPSSLLLSLPRHQQSRPNPAPSGSISSRNSSSSTSDLHLSPAEKDRREKEGLCRYCGEKGHFKRDCDAYKRKVERNVRKGTPRFSAPVASSSHVNAVDPSSAPAPPVTVSHVISASGKYNPQGH